ncbi:MAG: 4Fe-4S binding protein [Nanoarchaeota archaeon]|nr:4Fe-4S binding protein [Nanoarchaeota archaeon]
MSWNINNRKCLSCGACVGVCPVNALRLTEHGVEVDKNKCILCNTCATICPVKAIKVEK